MKLNFVMDLGVVETELEKLRAGSGLGFRTLN
jgi:hypothetical protein